MTTLLQSLATTCARPVTPADRARAARHVLDWLGCAVAGAVSPQGRVLATLAEPGDTPLAGGGTASSRSAALINGGLGNVLEMDDVHRTAILHPGPVVIPAALALAPDAKAFLSAVVRGYEAMIRVGQSVGPAHYRHFHNTATCGPFGAAMAAASALRLTEEQSVHAMANAGSTAGGLWQMRHEDVPTKQLHAARAAEAGVTAALLAARGFTGPKSLLEGEQGFLAALCPDGDPAPIMTAYDRWLIHDVSFKPWPACRHAHPAIDAALTLRERAGTDGFETIHVRTYADAIKFCDQPEPATPAQARFSLQHAVAVALRRGAPDLSAFEMEAVTDPGIAALRARITVDEDAFLTDTFPARYGVAIEADGGRTAEARDALGDPARPLADDRLRAKAVMLMEAGGRGADADRLCDLTLSLPGGGWDAWRAAVAG